MHERRKKTPSCTALCWHHAAAIAIHPPGTVIAAHKCPISLQLTHRRTLPSRRIGDFCIQLLTCVSTAEQFGEPDRAITQLNLLVRRRRGSRPCGIICPYQYSGPACSLISRNHVVRKCWGCELDSETYKAQTSKSISPSNCYRSREFSP